MAAVPAFWSTDPIAMDVAAIPLALAFAHQPTIPDTARIILRIVRRKGFNGVTSQVTFKPFYSNPRDRVASLCAHGDLPNVENPLFFRRAWCSEGCAKLPPDRKAYTVSVPARGADAIQVPVLTGGTDWGGAPMNLKTADAPFSPGLTAVFSMKYPYPPGTAEVAG